MNVPTELHMMTLKSHHMAPMINTPDIISLLPSSSVYTGANLSLHNAVEQQSKVSTVPLYVHAYVCSMHLCIYNNEHMYNTVKQVKHLCLVLWKLLDVRHGWKVTAQHKTHRSSLHMSIDKHKWKQSTIANSIHYVGAANLRAYSKKAQRCTFC